MYASTTEQRGRQAHTIASDAVGVAHVAGIARSQAIVPASSRELCGALEASGANALNAVGGTLLVGAAIEHCRGAKKGTQPLAIDTVNSSKNRTTDRLGQWGSKSEVHISHVVIDKKRLSSEIRTTSTPHTLQETLHPRAKGQNYTYVGSSRRQRSERSRGRSR